jgi:hypothetical protein
LVVIQRRRHGLRTVVCALTCVVAALLASAPAAFAGIEGWYGFWIGPGDAWATGSAHSYVWDIWSDTNHTSCPAVGAGWGGLENNPRAHGDFLAYIPCGYNGVDWMPNPTGDYLHGVTYDPNVSTSDFIYSANYSW